MTIPARYSLTEAHVRIVQLERLIQRMLLEGTVGLGENLLSLDVDLELTDEEQTLLSTMMWPMPKETSGCMTSAPGPGSDSEESAGVKPSAGAEEKVRVRDLWHEPTCAIFTGKPSCSCGAVAEAVKEASRP